MSRPVTSVAGRHLVICNWRDSAHPQAGGAELYCEEVARQLHAAGAKVTLLTSRPPGTAARQRVDFGTIVRRGGTFGTYPQALLWLAANRRRIDGVIDSENGIPYFSPLVLPRRVPVVLVIHHVHQEQFAMYFPPVAAAMGRFLEKRGAQVVYGDRPVCVVSPSARAELRRQLAFRGPVYIAPNGLSVSPAFDDVARSREPRIVCVGRMVPHKRYELLIEAVPALVERWPELRVDMVGDGEARAGLEKRVADLGLAGTFVFHGRVGRAERDRLTATAWLTVNATAGEGWGLSVVEAAAHGVPSVAFRVPGMQDSVRHRDTGWLVDDPSALVAGIDEALREMADPERAAQWAERCRDWAGSFTWEATADRLVAVLVGEGHRLGYRLDERRHRTDAMTMAEVPRHLAGPEVIGRLRATDQVRVRADREDTVDILFGNADERDAERALERIGVPPARVVRTRIARHHDLLGWLPRRRAHAWPPSPDEGVDAEVILLQEGRTSAAGAPEDADPRRQDPAGSGAGLRDR